MKPNLFIILSSPQALGQSKDTNLSLFLSEMSFEYIFYAYVSRFNQNNTNSQLSGSVLWYTVGKTNMRLTSHNGIHGILPTFKPLQCGVYNSSLKFSCAAVKQSPIYSNGRGGWRLYPPVWGETGRAVSRSHSAYSGHDSSHVRKN